MRKRNPYISIALITIVCLLVVFSFSIGAEVNADTKVPRGFTSINLEDTLKTRFPIAKTFPKNYKDIKQKNSMDLKDPENIKTSIEYDVKTGKYLLKTLLGDDEIVTPFSFSQQEYLKYTEKEERANYFRDRINKEFSNEPSEDVKLTDLQFGIGAAESIFGPGGVRIRTQGSAEIGMGIKKNHVKNPSLPERTRNRSFFDFNQKVQMNVNATVGDRVRFGMNYNTESTFDFDARRLKLAYEGKEDDIIKLVEVGNVGMNTTNSLIRGGAALFGVHTEMQFGKLRIGTLFSQQESESKTVNSRGGVQTKPFELKADEYDENRHFFLSYYFRNQYDYAMAELPFVRSSVQINRVEVWVTNKRGSYEQARNIVAFSDLGEHDQISNKTVQKSGALQIPYNGSNSLYHDIVTNYSNARDISRVSQTLEGRFSGGLDFEAIESARLLEPSEYSINRTLGYISLKSQLQPDEVLAVAYEYTYGGSVYQVGEFSTDNRDNTVENLYVKLLKGTTMSPNSPYWKLMMKNVYSLRGAYSLSSEKFKMNIYYQSDTTGVYLPYINEGKIKEKILLNVMNLDRLDSKNEPYPDGVFDFVEGFTVDSRNGFIIFPSVEPFGSYLESKFDNKVIAAKYTFHELYDTTLIAAREFAEKNKFVLRGEYKATSGAEIQLDATNVARGSVRVTSGGILLKENVDYTVDYASGRVTILNENVLASGNNVSVSLENRSTLNMQRKTLFGVNLDYEFSKNLNIGATAMHLSEMPLTTKTTIGSESVKNTLWGMNLSYRKESQWLTNVFDKLPFLALTEPSKISLDAEFANLIAGHYQNKYTGRYSYLDDFESSQTGYDLLNPYPWSLASIPYEEGANARFPESALTNDVEIGKNRALLAWYYIDGLFTRRNSTLVPSHIKKDLDQLSNHYVREITVKELYPNRDIRYNENSTIPVLNLAFYPTERGPYNLDAKRINSDGTLMNPEKRWGGIMRKMDQSDFEAANIEYIEFWMLDPYIYDPQAKGGDLFFNLGEISEDVLKDEKKFFENGLPLDGDEQAISYTPWGKVPKRQSTVYAFDNAKGARKKQDVGLNGLSSQEEKGYPSYVEYLKKLQEVLAPATVTKMMEDPFSPFNDPAGDDYHYFRGADYDINEVDILSRYKRYNGTEGNSVSSEDSPERYDTSARTLPDGEDINQDNTLNQTEKYFEYKVSLRPTDLQVGRNYIVDKRETEVSLRNGKREKVTWYQFKIPIREYLRRVGSISDFKTIRFMRLFMTDFEKNTVLRFGSFRLVRGDWRVYTRDLSSPEISPISKGTMDMATVNIEENGTRKPVNYVLPPGVLRNPDPGQPQITQLNEQSLSMKLTNLAPGDARAVYKNVIYDLRRYKRLQMFSHAEALIKDKTILNNGELSLFIRLGSDYKNNYYEYEIPLKLTPHGTYSNKNVKDQEIVWPKENMFDFSFDVLTDLKLKRNSELSDSESSYYRLYSDYDPKNNRNKISIIGNPSLAEVKVIMIGVRNNSAQIKSGEVWINELRLADLDEQGGWAANAKMNVEISDFGTVNMTGQIETAGFGAIDQSISERRMDDFEQYSITTMFQLGKFFPEKAHVSFPVYYSYSKETLAPKYNPLDQDILLKDALEKAQTKHERDSIKDFSYTKRETRSISFNNVRVGIKSRNPMPYDPANFGFSFNHSKNTKSSPEFVYDTQITQQLGLTYDYVPFIKPIYPLEWILKGDDKQKDSFFRNYTLKPIPSLISFQSNMLRNYEERQVKNLTSPEVQRSIPVMFSHNFLWDRNLSINWDLTPNLKIRFYSGTNARIEEPHLQVNKRLAPDDYAIWKDSVKRSIRDLGTPMKHDQKFSVTYTLPTQMIKALNWINLSTNYSAAYNWDRGANLQNVSYEIGNILSNQRSVDLQGSLAFTALYNNMDFVKKSQQRMNKVRERGRGKKSKPRRNKQELHVQLSPDSAVVIRHGLMSKKIELRAKDENGKRVKLDYKVLNYADIQINTRDSILVNVTLVSGPSNSEEFSNYLVDLGIKALTMLKNINFVFQQTDGMMLPGFRPQIGNFFGQASTLEGNAPGWGFAFGRTGMEELVRMDNNNWLVKNQQNITPASINKSLLFNGQIMLEPLPDLKITLNMDRLVTQNTQVKFMFPGMPESLGGNFTMTTISLGSAFEKMSADDGFKSAAFDRFLENRQYIHDRIINQYQGKNYPNIGFLENDIFAGKVFDPAKSELSLNSPDVLIPAFIAAYTSENVGGVELTAFPSFKKLRPNWSITYSGLSKLPFFKKHFKQIQLSHNYRSSYNVGGYTSYLNWVGIGDDLGFIRNATSGNPTPSSPYDISAVSIIEALTPLFGVDVTMNNNITARSELKKTRNLNLNLSSFQLVHSYTDEVVLGVGYKVAQFDKLFKKRRKKNDNFNHELNVRLDYSFRKMQSLIRKIEEAYTQAISGNKAHTIQFSADYALSRALSLRAFYDVQVNEPLVSSTTFPTTNSNFGVSLRFTLTQ